jgi:hypothetical protein
MTQLQANAAESTHALTMLAMELFWCASISYSFFGSHACSETPFRTGGIEIGDNDAFRIWVEVLTLIVSRHVLAFLLLSWMSTSSRGYLCTVVGRRGGTLMRMFTESRCRHETQSKLSTSQMVNG